jgi:hypothetical protein
MTSSSHCLTQRFINYMPLNSFHQDKMVSNMDWQLTVLGWNHCISVNDAAKPLPESGINRESLGRNAARDTKALRCKACTPVNHSLEASNTPPRPHNARNCGEGYGLHQGNGHFVGGTRARECMKDLVPFRPRGLPPAKYCC